jgi:hypothetical protein
MPEQAEPGQPDEEPVPLADAAGSGYVVVAWERPQEWEPEAFIRTLERAGGPVSEDIAANFRAESAAGLAESAEVDPTESPEVDPTELDAAVIRALGRRQWAFVMRRLLVVRVESANDAVALYGALNYVANEQFTKALQFAISPLIPRGTPWGGLLTPPWENVNAVTGVGIDIRFEGFVADVAEGEQSS